MSNINPPLLSGGWIQCVLVMPTTTEEELVRWDADEASMATLWYSRGQKPCNTALHFSVFRVPLKLVL